jgi:hypothetical protein
METIMKKLILTAAALAAVSTGALAKRDVGLSAAVDHNTAIERHMFWGDNKDGGSNDSAGSSNGR